MTDMPMPGNLYLDPIRRFRLKQMINQMTEQERSEYVPHLYWYQGEAPVEILEVYRELLKFETVSDIHVVEVEPFELICPVCGKSHVHVVTPGNAEMPSSHLCNHCK